MRQLFHLWLSAPSRIVRIALAEKRLPFDLKVEKVWERRVEFMSLNPAGEVPVLIEPDGTSLTDAWVIMEYLDEVYPEVPLIGPDPVSRAEARRLLVWFDRKFAAEVTDNLVGQKVMTRLLRQGQPDSAAIRAGKQNIHYHLDYVGFLAEQRRWLAGEDLTIADIACAAHLSVVDYLGDVPWDEHPEAKEWYQRFKSRPSVRPLLDDAVPGVPPPAHYADLDF
jgi:glutathione S-transferase